MFKGGINAYEVTLPLMWSRDKRAWSGTWGQYNMNSWKDGSLDSRRCGNGLFLFSFFPSILQWPKSGTVNSNGAPELKFLCVFWIVIRESIQPLFYRRNIFWENIRDVRPVGGCWVTYDSQIWLQKSLDFCITVQGGLFQSCLLKSTLRCLNGVWGTLTE